MKGEIDFSVFESINTTPWIVDVLRDMLEKDPSKRITASEALEWIQNREEVVQMIHKFTDYFNSPVERMDDRKKKQKKSIVRRMKSRTRDLSVVSDS